MPATVFITKLYKMLNDADTHDTETHAVVSWGLSNDSVLIKEQGALGSQVLPRYFKHGNVSSFVRQLNMYGFRKRAAKTMEFYSPLFKKVIVPSFLPCVESICVTSERLFLLLYISTTGNFK
jgi:hypothetical protein